MVAPLLFITFIANWQMMAEAYIGGVRLAPEAPPRGARVEPDEDDALVAVYVDDTAVSCRDTATLEASVEAWIWTIEANGLRANEAKFELISTDATAEINIKGNTIKAGQAVRYLGVFLSSGPDPLVAAVERKMKQCDALRAVAKRSGITRKGCKDHLKASP